MNPSSKVLSILGLFSKDQPVWQPEAICAALGFTRATGYRYLKELVEFGLLKKVSARHYALGPRIIELDYQLRQSDPMLLAADPAMHALSQQTGMEVVLTVIMGRKQVIDIHRVHALSPITTSVARSRGRTRPMFRGGAPKILLAHLPRAQQQQLYHQHHAEIAACDMGHSWEGFKDTLVHIKKAGFYLSWGELEPDVGAAVVPVFSPEEEVVAALNLLGSAAQIQALDVRRTRAQLEQAAWKVRQHLASAALVVAP